MANFFGKFPNTPYIIDRDRYKVNNYQMPVNILVRIGLIKKSLDAAFNYAEYVIQDGETPELLAERTYGDPEAHWMIMISNDIYDPNYDWPLNYDAFGKYLISKYGSIANAQTQVHHYEKIIKSVDQSTRTETYDAFQIDVDQYNALPASAGTYYSKNIKGYVVDIYDPYRNVVYCYDWEVAQNDQKRNIKLIKPDYYPSIKSQFEKIMQDAKPNAPSSKPGIRSLV